jgi:N-acetylglucosamine-6-phosphate deacetylase
MRAGVEAAIVDGARVPGDVEIEDGRVVAVGIGERGGSGIAVPGLVDLQVNGYAGVDLLAEPERAPELAAALARTGVTAWQPTLITDAPERTLAALRAIRAAGVVGIHLEGPFLSPARAGAHPRQHLRAPDLGLLRSFLDAGAVSIVTLAPELPGALELVEELVGRGVGVSLGHSDATAEEAHAAFARGARTVTHLFNAMRPFAHRDPGVAGAALAREDVLVQLIADGVHLAPETVLVAWRAARGRLGIVSDAISAAGLGDGTYALGEVEVRVEGGVSRRADGTLAGGVATVVDGIRGLCELGVPLVEAVDAATRVPARILRRDDVGTLAPGARADLAVLDDRLEVVRVLVAGETVD